MGRSRGGKGGGKGGPIGGLVRGVGSAFSSVVNSNPLTKGISDAVTNASDSIGLKQPLDDLGQGALNVIDRVDENVIAPIVAPLMPEIPEPPAPAPISAPDMQGQTIGMSGADTTAAGGEFDLGEDEDEQTLRSRRKKRRGRVELMGPGVGVGTGTSDVGVKI